MIKHCLSLVVLVGLFSNLYTANQTLNANDAHLSTDEQQVVRFFQSLEERIIRVDELLTTAYTVFEKRALTAPFEKIGALKKYLIDRVEHIQNFSLKMAALDMHKKSNDTATISPEELDTLQQSYTRYLELFYQELEILLELLMPLKDCDTMTPEEINAILTI
jgi:histone deacetylase complex regulatory component SIN3